MRYLPDVIEQMLAVVPESEEDLRRDLGNLRASALYAAPEIMGRWWRSSAETLIARFGKAPQLDAQWKRQMFDIWGGRK